MKLPKMREVSLYLQREIPGGVSRMQEIFSKLEDSGNFDPLTYGPAVGSFVQLLDTDG